VRKRLIALLAVFAACASAAPPPGGPEDKEPPRLVHVSPDTNAVNFHGKVVTFQFNETINDRGEGPQDIRAFFLVSPSDGEPKIGWHRSHIDIGPRHGFRDGTAYTITLLPGLSDLQNNHMKTGATVVFSTGATIPPYKIDGVVFDWMAEHPAPLAYIEALTPDSIRYLAQADSNGKFSIGPLVQGTYLVRGIIDANNNRALDRNESYDTLRVSAPVAGPIELLAAARDTLPVRISTVDRADSSTLTVTFDRPLDPAQTIDVSAFRLIAADSTVLTIARALTPRTLKLEQEAAAKVASDSLKAATDSIRRADSLAGKKLAPIAPAAALPATPPLVNGKAPPPPPPKPSRPPPFTVVTLKLARPLANNAEFRLSATGLRALSGRTQPSERRFTTPKPPPVKKDSTAAKAPAPRPDAAATGAPARRDSSAVARPPARPPGTPFQ
jgi:hypothetical protein